MYTDLIVMRRVIEKKQSIDLQKTRVVIKKLIKLMILKQDDCAKRNAPVICMPRPLWPGITGLKCRDLTYNVSRPPVPGF